MKNISKLTFFLFLLSLFFFNFYELPAQKQGQARIDSLLNELPKAKEDTNKVRLLNALSYQFYMINPDEGIKYGEQELRLAEKLRWKKGISWAYGVLGNNYFTKSNYSKALEYWTKSLKICEEIGDKSGIALGYCNLGNFYSKKSNFKNALEYYFKALKIMEVLNDKSEMASVLANIGMKYGAQADYPKALEYFFKALKIAEELGDKSTISVVLLNIGGTFERQSNFPKALDYQFKALKIAEELGQKRVMAYILATIGGIYEETEIDKTNALKYLLRALKIAEEIGDKSNQFSILNIIATTYLASTNYSKALEFNQKSLKISNELGDLHSASDVLGQRGAIYYYLAEDSTQKSKKNFTNPLKKLYLSKAIESLEECIKIHKEIGMKHAEMLFLDNLIKSYEAIGNYKKAFENYKRYIAVKDSTFSFEKSKEIANLQANYKVEKKEKENKILKLEIKQQNTVRNYLIIISLLILLLAMGIYYLYWQKRKTNNILEEKNQKLNEANELIERTYNEKIQIQEESFIKENEIMKLNNELMEKELEQSHKELTALALTLVEKNEYLAKLKDQAESIAQTKAENVVPLVRSIIRSININSHSEESWQVFETQFKAIHRGFLDLIASRVPDLSVMEMKICALLKINLSSKEIASLLNLSLRTVEDHRLNIRRKMNLDKDVNLNQYMAHLNTN